MDKPKTFNDLVYRSSIVGRNPYYFKITLGLARLSAYCRVTSFFFFLFVFFPFKTEPGRDPKKDLHVLDEGVNERVRIVASMKAKPANLFVRRTTSRPQSGLSSRCSQ
ncbi:hypothetical protein ALC62_12800 [Cyphomyrmex costatus]|uniref:Uncharacterized protein n=1 Tax=Cyphomyrmex costatus TaxID=456900 RepID=A0A151IAP5_9HYME|nr:hypothetical protein ALC62_12800 [Cyphomyrmex costatus]